MSDNQQNEHTDIYRSMCCSEKMSCEEHWLDGGGKSCHSSNTVTC